MASEHDDRVRDRAYHLWRESGGEHGKEMEHWLQAESEMSGKAPKGKIGTAKVPAAPPPAKAAAKASAPSAAVKKAPKSEPAKAAEGKAPAPAKTAKPRSGKSPA